MNKPHTSQPQILPGRPSAEFSHLYPELPPDEAAAAEERFKQYIALVVRIYRRLLADPEAYRTAQRLLAEGKRGTKR